MPIKQVLEPLIHSGDCLINGVWAPVVFISEWFFRTVQ